VFREQLPSKEQGFTLLEIMLVLLLIGMLSVGVVMTLPDSFTSEQEPQWQAQRFRTLMQLAEDEALISGQELGLVLAEDGYQFAFYDYQTKKWLPVMNKQIQDKVVLPETMTLSYTLAGALWEELDSEKQDDFIEDDDLVTIEGEEEVVDLQPQVYVMASGEVTPFSAVFSVAEQKVTVSVSMSGAVSVPELP
jgi:general secretion pathway protein H